MKETYYLQDGSDYGTITVLAYLTHDFESTAEKPRYMLNRIEVASGTPTHQGWGTKLLQQICDDADKEQVELILGVSPDDDQWFWPLARWYDRFHFRMHRDKLTPVFNVMLRKPQDRAD